MQHHVDQFNSTNFLLDGSNSINESLDLDSQELYYPYTNNAFPISNFEVLTVNFYDNVYELPQKECCYGREPNYKGLATGSKIRVLDTDKWVYSSHS